MIFGFRQNLEKDIITFSEPILNLKNGNNLLYKFLISYNFNKLLEQSLHAQNAMTKCTEPNFYLFK
jgi:hypothetical protein